MKNILFAIMFIFSFSSLSCDLSTSNEAKSIKSWIGSNSNFSKSFTKGKCALDEVLNNLPVRERKVIANLIAKSYAFEAKNLDILKTYNY